MQLSHYHYYVLSLMGIPVWESRHSTATSMSVEKTDTDALEMNDPRQLQVDWLILADTQLDDNAQRLLAAMLKAIGLNYEKIAIFSGKEMDVIQKLMTVSHKALVFDETVARQLAVTSMRFVSLPSLEQMLKEPVTKRQAWDALQHYSLLV